MVEVGVWSEDFEAFDCFVPGVFEYKVMDLLGSFDVDGVFLTGFLVELLCVHLRVLIMKVVWVFFKGFLLLL